eukprot:TRINITY_DN15624_c0_g1_i1.p2 TRINITY_DN15624_c0_g1~~TRINITY_DN15624_c0_g1_i1.p2  ORF type:complete len:126 (+),score=27.88 TRINITY_DN15624_c0_g1_i1:382-759(+)
MVACHQSCTECIRLAHGSSCCPPGPCRDSGNFSVYTGAPGMAYMCMRLASMPGIDQDAKLLFLRMGHEYLQDEAAPPAMRRAMNQVGPSLLCGYAGYHCVAALFSKRVAADAAAAAAAAQVRRQT